MDTLPRRSRALVASVFAIALLGGAACSPPGSGDGPELSHLRSGTTVTGRVAENVTACEVDAVCYLRIEFADSTVEAVYGTGERPAPECEIPVEASDAAFTAVAGDVVQVVVVPCAGEGLFLRALER
jgi:hypothetical protein